MALNPGFGLSPYKVVLVATLVVGAAVAGVAVWSLTRPVSRLPTRFAITLPSRVSPAVGQNVAISPDGRTLVYAADQLYRREMAQLGVQPIPGTESAFTPFFSPDGQWVGFSQPGSLRRMSLAGGHPSPWRQRRCEARAGAQMARLSSGSSPLGYRECQSSVANWSR